MALLGVAGNVNVFLFLGILLLFCIHSLKTKRTELIYLFWRAEKQKKKTYHCFLSNIMALLGVAGYANVLLFLGILLLFCWRSRLVVGEKRPRSWFYTSWRPHRIIGMWIQFCRDTVCSVRVTHVCIWPSIGHNIHWWWSRPVVWNRRPQPRCNSWWQPHGIIGMRGMFCRGSVSLVRVISIVIWPRAGHHVHRRGNWPVTGSRKPHPSSFQPAMSPYKKETIFHNY